EVDAAFALAGGARVRLRPRQPFGELRLQARPLRQALAHVAQVARQDVARRLAGRVRLLARGEDVPYLAQREAERLRSADELRALGGPGAVVAVAVGAALGRQQAQVRPVPEGLHRLARAPRQLPDRRHAPW